MWLRNTIINVYVRTNTVRSLLPIWAGLQKIWSPELVSAVKNTMGPMWWVEFLDLRFFVTLVFGQVFFVSLMCLLQIQLSVKSVSQLSFKKFKFSLKWYLHWRDEVREGWSDLLYAPSVYNWCLAILFTCTMTLNMNWLQTGLQLVTHSTVAHRSVSTRWSNTQIHGGRCASSLYLCLIVNHWIEF